MAVKPKQMSGKEFVKKLLRGERNFSGIKLEEGFDLSGHNCFEEVQAYLKGQDLKNNPHLFDDSEFLYFHAAGIHLPFARGKNANFHHAYLQRAMLENTELQHADFNDADLESARLSGANLEQARMERAYLAQAYLAEAKLNKVKLWNANLGRAMLQRADLSHAKLGYASLAHAILDGTDMSCALLENARLDYAQFRNANVQHADFRHASMEGTDLRGVQNLELGVNLEHAHLRSTKVTYKEHIILYQIRAEGEAIAYDVE